MPGRRWRADGKQVKLNHVYAVQQAAAGDLCGDEEMTVRLFFTAKPVSDPGSAQVGPALGQEGQFTHA
ncbi:MAG TPA: hypothetical protein VN643_27995 [Pyrinomonadaceae bacterium]|nr:hypothetical protein [Pyrinomonadaceae bacterium]